MKNLVSRISDEIQHFSGCDEITGVGERSLIFQVYVTGAILPLICNTFMILVK